MLCRALHSKLWYCDTNPIHRRKCTQEDIPYCHMQLNMLLKCKLLYLSTWIFISSVYTTWVMLAADKESVFFTPGTFSCYWPSQLWFPQRRCSSFSSVAFKGVLLQHLWHLSRNVTSPVCTLLTAEHTRDLHSDGNTLQPGAEKRAWCSYSSAL